MRRAVVVSVLSTVLGVFAAGAADIPRLSLRMRGNQNADDATWASTLKAISENPGCCDDVWFSTGTAFPEIGWHRANADRIIRYSRELRERGISASLQFQATLGHGDSLADPELFTGKTWRGFTGIGGVECRYCNCPRQRAFLDYVGKISEWYAEAKPYCVWIDDDLRIANHRPATEGGGKLNLGCWCDDCIAAFNAETGGDWNRERLAEAVAKDERLFASWRKFSLDSVLEVARVVCAAFHKVSPGTMMGIQHCCGIDYVPDIVKTLRETTGNPVGVRPGGGMYYETDLRNQMYKAIDSGAMRRVWGDADYVSIWCPEVETWPRAYASRSAQSLIIEAFASVAYGMNSMSFFIMDSRYEDAPLYSVSLLKPLAAAAPVLAGYARACDETRPVGFSVKGDSRRFYQFALTGVPLVRWGDAAAELPAANLNFNLHAEGSNAIQARRDELDGLAGGLPAKLASPFVGLMIPRVDADGRLRTLALVNTRIDEQGPVEVLLREKPAAGKLVWRELRRAPVEVSVVPAGDGAKVVIPSIGAWNGGYFEF